MLKSLVGTALMLAATVVSGAAPKRLATTGLCLADIAGGPIATYSLSAESELAVVVLDARHPEILCLDLHDRRVIGRRDVVDVLPRLAIAADGRSIAVLHRLDVAVYAPTVISIWRPREAPATFTTVSAFVVSEGEGTTTEIAPDHTIQPSFSRDGRELAFIGSLVSMNPAWSSAQLDGNAVGIMDLESGKTRAIGLPIQIDPKAEKLWQVAWSADGREVYALVHGDYAAFVRAENAPAGTHVSVPAVPELSLYRVNPTRRAAEFVSVTPKETLGFDGNGGIVMRDGAGGFRRIPMDALLPRQGAGPEAMSQFTTTYPAEERVAGGAQVGSVWGAAARNYVVTQARQGEKPCSAYIEVRVK